MVDTLDLGSSAERCEGSSPFRPTNEEDMIVKELNSKKMYKEYSIEIPYKDVADSIDNKIKSILSSVELPGFRKGKAPLNVVKKKYENNVLAEVIENIAKENIKKLLNDKKLKPLRQPKVEISKYSKDNPLELKLKIDLEPKLSLIDFKILKMNKYEIKIDKKTYEENYNNYIKSQITYLKIVEDRPVKMGDMLIVDLKSENSFVPDFLRVQNNISIYTDSDYQILPDISKEIINKNPKINDIINLSFDLKDILKEKNTKIAKFSIEIKSIEEKKEIKINKEFLEKKGFKSEDELKNNVNESLKNQYDNLLKEIEKKQLYDLLESKHVFEIPEGIFEEEFNQIWQRVEKAKNDNTLDEDDKKLSDINLKKRYKNISTRRVKLAILMQKIAEKNSIALTNEELTNGLLEYASRYPGQEKQIFEFFKKNPMQLETIKAPIMENKVLDNLLQKTIRKNKTITINEFKKLQDKVFTYKEKN